jgi:hypothetical protein
MVNSFTKPAAGKSACEQIRMNSDMYAPDGEQTRLK